MKKELGQLFTQYNEGAIDNKNFENFKINMARVLQEKISLSFMELEIRKNQEFIKRIKEKKIKKGVS